MYAVSLNDVLRLIPPLGAGGPIVGFAQERPDGETYLAFLFSHTFI